MKYLPIILLLSLFSCIEKSERIYNVCSCEERNKAAEFVDQNIGPANNMSDEEMEDVIKELKKVSVQLFVIRSICLLS